MELYINKELNSLRIKDNETVKDKTFMILFSQSLTELDPSQKIKIILDMKYSPLVVVLYLRKVIQEMGDINMEIYHTEDSEVLKNGLISFDIPYFNIKDLTKGY